MATPIVASWAVLQRYLVDEIFQKFKLKIMCPVRKNLDKFLENLGRYFVIFSLI